MIKSLIKLIRIYQKVKIFPLIIMKLINQMKNGINLIIIQIKSMKLLHLNPREKKYF